tara:strand:+ start:4216 stop:4440 length:225 start_codon:yes stop_codon:yes gene_type:complete
MKRILIMSTIALVGCETNYSNMVIERITPEIGEYNGKCHILLGDGDWNKSNSTRIHNCKCVDFEVGDTIIMNVK